MRDEVHGGRIKELFMIPEVSMDDVHEALELIRSTDAVQRCMDVARGYINKALASLDEVPDSEYKQSMIVLAHYVVDRDR